MAYVSKIVSDPRASNTVTASPGDSTAVVSSKTKPARVLALTTAAPCQRCMNVDAKDITNCSAVGMERAAGVAKSQYATRRRSGILILFPFFHPMCTVSDQYIY